MTPIFFRWLSPIIKTLQIYLTYPVCHSNLEDRGFVYFLLSPEVVVSTLLQAHCVSSSSVNGTMLLTELSEVVVRSADYDNLGVV